MNMSGNDLREGFPVGSRLILGRAFPGGQGSTRRYRLRCACCGAESVMTHGAICQALRMLKAGRPEKPCPDCDEAGRPSLTGQSMLWGRKPEELWRPAPSRLPAGSISPAVAWPVPGRAARP